MDKVTPKSELFTANLDRAAPRLDPGQHITFHGGGQP